MAFVFVLGIVVGSQVNITFAQDATSPPPGSEQAFGAFWQTYNIIKDDYLNSADDATLVDGAIQGMVDSLGDDFSGYMSPDVFPMMNEDLDGEISGIGVVIRTNDDDAIEVVDVLSDSPAQKAGVMIGDIFAVVDGEDVTGVSQIELASRVRGPIGTVVEITFRRGDQLIDLAIKRDTIEIPNITSERLEGDIGYVKLFQFNPNSRADMDAAIESLNPDTLNGLVIDFRGNPGGLLDSAINVGSLLVNEGVLVTEDFGNRTAELQAQGNALNLEIPIVLLVDETSASASELVAGAWQDYGVATILGETTFGKGTVQTWHTLVNGGGVRITIARWLTPDGHWIHEQGITPDIVVEWNPTTEEEQDNDLQLQAAIEFLMSAEVESVSP
jgi:carboxyl-terminal processing protease